VHPDLVRFCRQGIPRWVLQVLVRYPTATALSRARPDVLARVPYVTEERAGVLIGAAKQSVAALCDPDTGTAVAALAAEIVRVEEQLQPLRRHLEQSLRADPQFGLLTSMPGIGVWTATVLCLELGAIPRFHSAAALVAYVGLDPRVRKSGDGERHIGISRAGRPRVRAALYLPAQTAVRIDPTFRAFYERLRAAGKEHKQALTACMAKLLRIAYACVVSGQRFDPERHAQVASRHEQQRPEQAEAVPASEHVGALEAPVSYREAKKRKAAAVPLVGLAQRARGPGAALPPDDNALRHRSQSPRPAHSKTT
jgi:hypothetical protein